MHNTTISIVLITFKAMSGIIVSIPNETCIVAYSPRKWQVWITDRHSGLGITRKHANVPAQVTDRQY